MYDTIAYKEVAIGPLASTRLNGVSVLGTQLSLKVQPKSAVGTWADWERLHQVWKGKSRKDVERDPRVQAYRTFYTQMGLDPSRTPPSVQGLVQRFLRDEVLTKIPVIHPIVDAVNLAAVESMVPLGVFDASRVKGEIALDLTKGGESFHPLGGSEVVSLEPGWIVLRDDEKVLSQFCHRDSDAQKITTNTTSVWLLGCQVPGVSAFEVLDALARAIELLNRDYTVETW